MWVLWVWSGFVLSLGLAGVAWWRSGARSRTFYEGEVYEMDARAHRKYALGFTIAATIFLAETEWPGWITRLKGWGIPEDWYVYGLLASVVLTGILYAAGFLRGATGEDE